MAIVHQATLQPTKQEIATSWLDDMGWGAGPVQVVGAYRFDDPDGEVGVEGLIVTRGDDVFHLPFTYRGAPLEGTEASLVATMQHSVLGTRYVYDAAHDPVAMACYARALSGDQAQAELRVYDGDGNFVEVRQTVVTVEPVRPRASDSGDVVLVRRIEEDATFDEQAPALNAHWPGDNAAIVAVG